METVMMTKDAEEIAAAEVLGCSVAVYRLIVALQEESAELPERIGNLEHRCFDLDGRTDMEWAA
jgi:hypothetical protein